MSYPQQNANDAVVKGADLFRLNTLLASPGDIYESSQGANAMALGPDSDIAEVNVTYFDAQQPLGINNVVLSTSRSMVGKLDVNNTPAAYLPAGRPGKILIAPANLWNPNFVPGNSLFNVDIDTQILETPRLDVIQYFHNQPSLVPQRRDKTYTFQSVPVSNTDASVSYVTIPFYGRKYAHVTMVHSPAGPQGGAVVGVVGSTLTIGDQSGAGEPAISVGLSRATLGSGLVYTFTVQAGGYLNIDVDGNVFTSNGGMFDLLSVFLVQNSGSDPKILSYFAEIIVSDTPCPGGVLPPPA